MQAGATPGASQGLSPVFTTQIQRAVSDGRLDKDEFNDLKDMVQGMDVPDSEKQAFLKLAEKIKDYTNVGLFTSDGVLENSEMQELTQLADSLKDSQLAGQLFTQFQAFAKPVEDTSLFGSIGNFFRNLFSGVTGPSNPADHETDYGGRRFQQSDMSPSSVNFPSNASAYAPTSGQTTPAVDAINGAAPISNQPNQAHHGSTYTSQWGDVALARNGQIPGDQAIHRRESEANCGPASASMILKQMGITPPDMHALRERIGARTSQNGNEGGAFAISTDQLEQIVKLYAADQGKQVQAETTTLPRDANQSLDMIRDRLARGEQVVLLTGGFGGTTGHYTVIKGVNPDGSFLVDDPARGPNQTRTAAELQRAMDTRAAGGKGESKIISFAS